ncbi:telomere-protecting terminal protein Tpg [Streptomyces sp. NPDC085460]|uniref:telomere-protecting terminal protein Tpg n=1 Tax=Streptomyces sp. NPDC085460 TaxID=3365723 RepID=UPI0037D24DEB
MVVKSIGEGLEQVLDKAVTRKPPQSVGAQARFLVEKLKSTKAAADLLGVSPRTVQRYLKGEITHPRAKVAGQLKEEVRKRWQPKVKERAKKQAAARGLMIDIRANLGYVADERKTDQARDRHITIALSPASAERIFAAQGDTEDRMRQAVAESLRQDYFQQGGTRAAGLDEIRMNNLHNVEFGL